MLSGAVTRLSDLLESDYQYHMSDVNDPDEVRQAALGLGTLAQRFELDFSDRAEELLERANELEEDVEEAESPHTPDEDAEPGPDDDEDEDDRIRELFSSLSEPVEPVDPENAG